MPEMTDLEALARARKYGAVRVISNRYKDKEAAKAHERKNMAMSMGTLMAEDGFITFTEQPTTFPPDCTEIRATAVILPPETQAAPVAPEMYVVLAMYTFKSGPRAGEPLPDFTDCTPTIHKELSAACEEKDWAKNTDNELYTISPAKIYRLVEVTEC